MNNALTSLTSVYNTPEPIVIWGSFFLALILVFTPMWSLSRNFITVVHEGGHAFIAKLTFRKVSGIKLHADTSGVTITRGKQYGLGAVLTTFAGYVAPSLLGLFLTALLTQGFINLATVTIAVIIFLILIMIRNLWGILILVPLSFGAYYLFQLDHFIQTAILTFIAAFLIVGSVKPVFELYFIRKRTGSRDNDADQLRKITLLPYHFWIFLFFFVIIASDLYSLLLWSSVILGS